MFVYVVRRQKLPQEFGNVPVKQVSANHSPFVDCANERTNVAPIYAAELRAFCSAQEARAGPFQAERHN